MSSHTQILNFAQHGDLKIDAKHDFKHMQAQQLVQLNMYEMPAAGTCFPLFFIKDRKSAKLFPIALLGLLKGQSLFYKEQQWLASYVPFIMRSVPFSIALHTDDNGKQNQKIAADIQSPYLNKTHGQALFTNGQPSAFLSQMQDMLVSDYQQRQVTVKFMQFLVEQNLIKAIDLDLRLDNQEHQKIEGIYTINQESLQNLQPEKVLEAHQRDYFNAIYCMLGSQQNLYELIKRSQTEGQLSVASLNITHL